MVGCGRYSSVREAIRSNKGSGMWDETNRRKQAEGNQLLNADKDLGIMSVLHFSRVFVTTPATVLLKVVMIYLAYAT